MSQPPPDRTPEARAIAARFPPPQGEPGELLARSSRDTAALDDLVRALTRRPVVAMRFVRLAGCSCWGPSAITGVRSAIEQVGASATPWVVLVLGVASGLQEARGSDPAHEAWARRAWTRALAALTFAKRARAPHAAEAFACAFLHGIGELALALARPAEWAELARAHAGAVPLEAQRGAFGCDRSEVEAALLEAWGVPALVAEVLARVTRAGEAAIGPDEELGALAESVSLAEATLRLFEEDDKGRALTRIEERAASAFGLAVEAVYEALSRLESLVRESLGLFEGTPGLALDRKEADPKGRPTARRNRGRTLPAELEHRRMIPSDPELLDPECGVPGREAFDRFLDREIQARMSAVVTRPLCVIVLSLEGFPRRHREQGAEAACAWLRETSRLLASRVRRGDLFARLGGSYFGVCMSEAEPHAMELLAGRLHESLAKHTGSAGGMTLGGACLAKAVHPDDGRALLRTGVRLLKQALEENESTRLLQAPIAPRRVA
jgi:GGDEF domain-containing protein/HD-like signal output (HDOD) protein